VADTNQISLNERLFKIALDTRNFEISLFWQRSNYFLVLNGALIVAVAKADGWELGIAFAGMVTSLLWFLVSLGSKYWQNRWEREVELREATLGIDPPLFGATQERTRQLVEQSFNWTNHGFLHRAVNRMVLRKPSVSLAMTFLSALFFVVWLVIAVSRLPGALKTLQLARALLPHFDVGWVNIAADTLAAISGLLAVKYWWQSSKVRIDPGWQTEPGDDVAAMQGKISALMIAFWKAAALNTKAALWTGFAVAFAALSTVLRLLVALR